MLHQVIIIETFTFFTSESLSGTWSTSPRRDLCCFPSSVNAFTFYNCILFWFLVPSFHSHFMSLCCMVHVRLVLNPDPQHCPAMWVWARAWVLAKRADPSSQVFVRFPSQSLHTGHVKTVLAIRCPPRLTLGYTSLTVHEVVHEVHR